MSSRTKRSNFLLWLAVVCFIISVKSGTNIAFAKENEPLTTCMNNTTFLCFDKSKSGTTNNTLSASYFIPLGNYNSEYKYGCVIFPKSYLKRYNVYDNYLVSFEEKRITVENKNDVGVNKNGGRVFRFGIENLSEKDLDIEYCFVYYIMDVKAGNVVYGTRQFISFNTVVTQEINWSNSETLSNQLKTVCIGYNKSHTTDLGYMMSANVYVPYEANVAGNICGILIFPEKYLETYNLTGDYITEIERQSILNIDISNNTNGDKNGIFLRYSICNMYEGNLTLPFVFIFYLKNGNDIAYGNPHTCVYNSLPTNNMSADVTNGINSKYGTSLNESLSIIVDNIKNFVDSAWTYIVIGLSSIVVVWGAVVGIKIAVARKNEQSINAKDMLKHLIIGVIIIFVLATCTPLLINGLSAWIG